MNALAKLLKDKFSHTQLSQLFNGNLMKIPPRPSIEEPPEYKGKDIDNILDPEASIRDLNIVPKGPIDWNEIPLSDKTPMKELVENKIFNFQDTDCIVQIENEEFNCHLIVLRSFSEFFSNIYPQNIIKIPSEKCSPSIFVFIYEWMTGDDYIKEITKDMVLDVFKAAMYFNIKDLVEQCWSFIDSPHVFTEGSAFTLYSEAKAKNLPQVCQLMLPRIQEVFLLLVSSRNWLELSFDEVQIFLKSNYILVNSELEIFMSAVRWLFWDWNGRKKFKVPIMGCIRFGNMESFQLIDITRNPKNPEFIELFRDPELSAMVDDGLSFTIIKESGGQEYAEWQKLLNLEDPPSRNWTLFKKEYKTFKDFLRYLETVRIRKRKTLFNRLAQSSEESL